MKNRFTASEEIVVNEETIRMLRERNKNLKPRAIKELIERGFSYDSIAKLLGMGKVTILNLQRRKKRSGIK